jgi:hypothetical protein
LVGLPVGLPSDDASGGVGSNSKRIRHNFSQRIPHLAINLDHVGRRQVRLTRAAPAWHRQHPGADGAEHAAPLALDLAGSTNAPRAMAFLVAIQGAAGTAVHRNRRGGFLLARAGVRIIGGHVRAVSTAPYGKGDGERRTPSCPLLR